jgi:hypothetical protein
MARRLRFILLSPNAGDANVNTKQRIGAAAAGLVLVLGVAQAGSETGQAAPARPQAGLAAEVPQGTGAMGSDVIVLDLAPMQGQASDEEIAAMQMLLLQLLMMQQEMGSSEAQMMRPDSVPGVEI